MTRLILILALLLASCGGGSEPQNVNPQPRSTLKA